MCAHTKLRYDTEVGVEVQEVRLEPGAPPPMHPHLHIYTYICHRQVCSPSPTQLWTPTDQEGGFWVFSQMP